MGTVFFEKVTFLTPGRWLGRGHDAVRRRRRKPEVRVGETKARSADSGPGRGGVGAGSGPGRGRVGGQKMMVFDVILYYSIV